MRSIFLGTQLILAVMGKLTKVLFCTLTGRYVYAAGEAPVTPLLKVKFVPVMRPKSTARSPAARMTPQYSLGETRIWPGELDAPAIWKVSVPFVKAIICFWPRA
jgi:hypothetical protein